MMKPHKIASNPTTRLASIKNKVWMSKIMSPICKGPLINKPYINKLEINKNKPGIKKNQRGLKRSINRKCLQPSLQGLK